MHKFHLLPIGWALQWLEDREKRQTEQDVQQPADRAREASARESDVIFLMNSMGYPREEAEKIAAEIAKLPLNARTFVRAAQGHTNFATPWAIPTWNYTSNAEREL